MMTRGITVAENGKLAVVSDRRPELSKIKTSKIGVEVKPR
jgi:hypothetical protein